MVRAWFRRWYRLLQLFVGMLVFALSGLLAIGFLQLPLLLLLQLLLLLLLPFSLSLFLYFYFYRLQLSAIGGERGLVTP